MEETMKIIEIDTDCNMEELKVQGNIGEFIRSRLDGYMEIVHPRGLKAPFIMIVDEEGLLKELPINPVGCALYETHKHGQPIVGKIVIAKIEELPDEDLDIAGLTDDDLKDFTALYGCGITNLKVARKEGKI